MREGRRLGRSVGRIGLVSAIVVALAGLTSPAEATVVINRYTMAVSGSPAAGAPASFSVVIHNEGLGILNKLDMQVPAAYTVTGATTSKGSISRSGNLVKLRRLLVLPTRSFTITVSAEVACSTSGSATWSAKNVKGVLGIPYSLDAGGSSRETTVGSSCYLKFLSHPQDAAPGGTIPGGEGPVSVGLFNGADGAITTGASVDVTMGIDTNPGGGTLSGTLTQPTSGGVASFGDLSIDAPGEGYRLSATAAYFNGASSDPFTVVGVVVDCAADEDCEASLGDGGNTSAFISAPANGSSAMIVASFTQAEGQGIDCDGYEESSASTLVFDVQNTGEGDDRPKTVEFAIDTDLGYPDPADFQVCYESETPFYARGQEGQVTLGLLLDCAEYPDDSYSDPVYNDPPCILERDIEGSTVFLTAQLPGGDPKGRV